MTIDRAELLDTLRERFGHSEFRSGQEEIILNVLASQDTLVVMPTGGGKSLCYQLPALFMEGTAIVVSPLIALMADQCLSLQNRGIPAAFINSTMSSDEISETVFKCYNGFYKLIYIAPERLENNRFIEQMKGFNISFVAVDEAHCISEWGHDFRPSYLKITSVIETVGRFPIIALTATATPEVQEDIIKQLKLRDPQSFIKGFDRPNLSYITELCREKLVRIKEIYDEDPSGSTIIYCGTRKRVDEISEGLQMAKLKVVAYHAGMEDYLRKRSQDQFTSGEAKIIVATNAFGMGVDKPDVRNLIHIDFTTTLEEYYQEAGRAGRDGLPSKCYLLFNNSDKYLPRYFIKNTFPNKEDIREVYDALYDIHQTATGNIPNKPIYLNSFEIGNKLKISQSIVESCMKLFIREGIIRRGQSSPSAKIQFLADKDRITQYFDNLPQEKKRVLEAFLRSVSREAFRKSVSFDYWGMKLKHKISDEDINDAVRNFEFAQILHFDPPEKENGIVIIKERMASDKMPIDFKEFYKRRSRAYEKLGLVFGYAETFECKRNYILNYFNETDVRGACGRCSSCNSKIPAKKTQRNDYLLHKVLEGAAEIRGLYGRRILASVLQGKKIKKVTNFGLENSSIFAIASNFSLSEINEQIDNALERKLLIISGGLFPKVVISEKGRQLLLGYKLDYKNVLIEKPLNKGNGTQLIPQKEDRILENLNQQKLYEILNTIRHEIAYKEVQTPLSLVSDLSLRKMSEYMPVTLEDMVEETNCSYEFAKNFGKRFIEAISLFKKEVLEHKTKELQKLSRTIIKTEKTQIEENPIIKLSEESIKAIEHNKSGFTLAQSAHLLGISEGKTALLLQDCIENGYEISIRNYVTREDFTKVHLFIKSHLSATLSEIKDATNINYGFPVIRVLSAYSKYHLNKIKKP